jgi:hypothetical protein
MPASYEEASMESRNESALRSAATWEGRMRQIANCELPYEQALKVALECVEIAERYSDAEPQSMSPADPDARANTVVNLASALECNIRLAVYSLYNGDTLVEHDIAVQQLIDCGKRSDAPE